MILTCPNCGTQYVVKEGAIPPQGRQVRCAACAHSWHQDPEPTDEPLELGPEAKAGEAQVREYTHEESIAEATMIDPSTGPEAEERAYEEAQIEEALEEQAAAIATDGAPATVASAADYSAPPSPDIQPDDDFSPFAERDFVEPRRRSPLIVLLVVLLLVAAAAAAFWFYAPQEWRTRLGLAEATTPLQLSNPPHIERIQLASGNQLLTVAGRVINPTGEAHPVPPIYAELRDRAGKVVYTWTIAPPTQILAPGASASFNSAEVNVPAGAEDLTISLGQPKA